MHRSIGTIPALLLGGALLAACLEDEPGDAVSPAAATSPVGPRCLAAEGDLTGGQGGDQEIVPVTGMELAPGGEPGIGEEEAVDTAEAWRTDAGVGEGVEPRAEAHTVVAADDADLGLHADDVVWVVRYEGIPTPELTQTVTTDLACAFVIVDGSTGEAVVTQYTRYQP